LKEEEVGEGGVVAVAAAAVAAAVAAAAAAAVVVVVVVVVVVAVEVVVVVVVVVVVSLKSAYHMLHQCIVLIPLSTPTHSQLTQDDGIISNTFFPRQFQVVEYLLHSLSLHIHRHSITLLMVVNRRHDDKLGFDGVIHVHRCPPRSTVVEVVFSTTIVLPFLVVGR